MGTASTTNTSSTDRVWCETPSHGDQSHRLTADCIWPHYVGPAGRTPSVGHPLTIHD